jgi:hypothetical protein
VQYPTGVGGNPTAAAVADFNKDGKLDLAVSDLLTKTVSIFLGNGDGTFTSPSNYGTALNPSSVSAGDVNGDGTPDLVLTSSADNKLIVLLGNGFGGFQSPSLITTGVQPSAAVIADLNGDGLPDVAVPNSASETVSVLLNSSATSVVADSSSNPSMSGEMISLTVAVGGRVRGSGLPTGTVTIKNGNTTIATGVLASGNFSGQTAGLPVGQNRLSITYSGDGNFAPHTIQFTQTVNGTPDFSIGASPAEADIQPGGSGVFSITAGALYGFNNPISLSCSSGLPSMATCQFSGNPIKPGAGSSTLTISTAGNTARQVRPGFNLLFFALGLLVPGLFVVGLPRMRLRRRLFLNIAPLLGIAISLAGCGGGSSTGSSGGSAGTPAGLYTVTIAATSGSLQHNVKLTLKVE